MVENVTEAFRNVHAAIDKWTKESFKRAEQSQGYFGKIGWAAAGMSLLVVGALYKAGSAAASFALQLAKESSEITELKLAYEGLAQARGIDGGKLLSDLKAGTEQLIGTTDLLKNANRVLQSEIPISSDMYARLSANVHSLAKSAGADGVQAQNALTDALIKGNARGFQAIGIHINVKNAISEMAAAMGLNAGKLDDNVRLQAFYNELLERTDAAVKKLPPDFVSLDDAFTRTDKTLRSYLVSVGEAINRSGAFQNVLKRLLDKLSELPRSQKQLDDLTLQVNAFFISAARGIGNTLTVLGVLVSVWNYSWGIIKATVLVASGIIIGALYAMQSALAQFLGVLSRIPGAPDWLKGAAADAAAAADLLAQALKETADDVLHVFDGAEDTEKQFDAWAQAAYQTAIELEGLRGEIIRGRAGVQGHGDDAANTAEQQKKLNEALQKYGDLLRDVRGRAATPEQQNLTRLLEDMRKITALPKEISAEQRAGLMLEAVKAYDAEAQKLREKRAEDDRQLLEEGDRLAQQIADRRVGTEKDALARIAEATGQAQLEREQAVREHNDRLAKQRAQERDREISDAIAAAGAIEKAVEAARRSKLNRRIGDEAQSQAPQIRAELQRQLDALRSESIVTPEQVDQIVRLEAALESLNRLDMSPFQQLMANMREVVTRFATETTEAWAAFWADLVSGQENAGKKLLAALMNTVAGEIMVLAKKEAALAIVAAASMQWGAAARHAAAAAALGATAGIIRGWASSMAQTNQAGQAASFQQNVPRPTSNQVQVVNVGASGRAQSPAAAAAPQPVEVRLKVEATPGFVVKEVEKDYRANGWTRKVMVQNA
jgi:hypothetical protein